MVKFGERFVFSERDLAVSEVNLLLENDKWSYFFTRMFSFTNLMNIGISTTVGLFLYC